MDKIKVALSFIVYPFTMAHYFWMAFERRNDVELWTCGPFTGDWIPWDGGMRLAMKYVKYPDFSLPQQTIGTDIYPSMITGKLPWTPDLWVQIDAGWRFLERPSGKVVAHIQTDPHVLKAQYLLPRSYSDFTFCMQTPYMQPGERYLPYAHDPTIHYPEEQEKIYDACLVGLHYKTRTELVERLRSRGLNVFYGIGLVYDEYRKAYNQSKIALSWSSLKDLPARNWEALGMGLPLVCNRVPDMQTFFVEGEHYLGFDNVDEAERQVMRLLEDEELRTSIAEAGHRKVMPHTWDRRVEELLKTCKIL